MKEERKRYSFKDILKFLSFDYKFEHDKRYPFNWGRDKVNFSWGQVLIPKYGIREMVQNKISDIKEKPITEIKMMYQIPFTVDGLEGSDVINQNISLSFRYDKTYKYGDIKSIYECCFWILEHAIKTDDFYIISECMVQDFFSCCIIKNQWKLGALEVSSSPSEKF